MKYQTIPPGGVPAAPLSQTNLGPLSACYLQYMVQQMQQVLSLQREIKEEKYAARRALVPMLQAEEDERFVKEWKKYLEEEARIMKDVPGWKVGESVYHSGKWMPPATGELRPDVW
ncbi:GRIM-19 protein [Actinidia rufa]|uniref:NADH dehydrogenase [ubiquinone] 1 alpha subcomplex subunit 13 n=1 Tax=Actinidia rufa TaxID=165716 RepID=A0A7J0E699_9ERIC|nr:GRIM-19 protein [Actinidia rufa]